MGVNTRGEKKVDGLMRCSTKLAAFLTHEQELQYTGIFRVMDRVI